MLDYLKIINKNLEHKGYFSSLISRYQGLNDKAVQKKESFCKLGAIGLAAMCISGLVSYAVFNSIISLGFLLGTVPMGMLLVVVKDFIGTQEIKYMNHIESEFFYDLKNNHELIKDLSLLVVDNDTEESFNEIVDNVVQDIDDNTFGSFTDLLYNYDDVQSEKDIVNERRDFLRGLKVNVRQTVEKENPQEFQKKAREKVLEML